MSATARKSATMENHEARSLQELETKFETSGNGLTSAQVQKHLQEYGCNELPEKKANPILKFLSYFWGPIPWMIEIAAILSLAVQHWADFWIIAILLVFNGLIGFWEEYQAGNAIAALKAQLALEAKVKRDGAWTTVAARELVPGDVIRLRMGDIVPADAACLSIDPIEVDQSALTGESLPVSRKREDQIYSGSIVRQGETDALVYATGRNTYFGKTAQLVETAQTVSHFQRAVLKIGDYLILIDLVLVAIILAVALFRGDKMLTVLEFALVLTVAAIPVAMPTVLSVTMAVGARILAAKEAIVSRLAAIEELAGVDVLCSDKTGTLTQNRLTVADPFCAGDATAADVFLAGALASRAENKDPLDLAVIGGVKDATALSSFELVHFQPFDPVHKRTEATVKSSTGKQFRVSKGALQVILALTRSTGQEKELAEQAVNAFASHGYRSIGVARADTEGQWRLLGVIPLYDPPREDSKATIEAAERLGVEVKMVTGDQIAIAREIARQVGLGTNILNAEAFCETKTHQAGQLAGQIERADGFAQVFPEHKFHIVEVLQERKHIVAMTGDGVNDAPALKKADAGIAVSGATDAARSAADIVLTSPGLSVIIDAIRESRKIFQRMNSYAIYRIAETIRVLLFMTLSILIFNFYPVTAVMIVLLALLNDGPILAIAYDRTRTSPEPEAWDMPLVLGISSVLGIAGVIASFLLFYLAERVFHLDRSIIQSFIFLKLVVAGHLTIFNTRTRGPFWSIAPAPSLLWTAILSKIVATLFVVYGWLMVPIGWHWALLIWGYALVWFVVNDRIKLAAYRLFSGSYSIFRGKLRVSKHRLFAPGARQTAS